MVMVVAVVNMASNLSRAQKTMKRPFLLRRFTALNTEHHPKHCLCTANKICFPFLLLLLQCFGIFLACWHCWCHQANWTIQTHISTNMCLRTLNAASTHRKKQFYTSPLPHHCRFCCYCCCAAAFEPNFSLVFAWVFLFFWAIKCNVFLFPFSNLKSIQMPAGFYGSTLPLQIAPYFQATCTEVVLVGI